MTTAQLEAMLRAAAARGEVVLYMPTVRQFVAVKPPSGGAK